MNSPATPDIRYWTSVSYFADAGPLMRRMPKKYTTGKLSSLVARPPSKSRIAILTASAVAAIAHSSPAHGILFVQS
ncbi:hypothetical protein CEP52_001597 [Fusarium oligoseptatum]|uniref:Uncharacterized protein n=1 Tax=Fusarium oligoseptatum TaxID=2604345 RepID=A0A428UI40_9HYPO|nr:hypothetical protein CEP52_001597 [Fusarium oligoseptatum]